MISDELKSKIRRLYHAEQWPVGTIARELTLHHSTVRRALLGDGVPLASLPTRKTKLDPYLPFVLDVLEKYPKVTASRIYDMVRERGYTGARDHFRTMVARHRKPKAAEAFLRLSTVRGEEAQVDWGHFGHIMIGGARRALVAFVMVLSWSRWAWLRFGLDMRMGSFLEHHEAAFQAWGGVPRVILYDNLKSAVTQRIGDAIVFNADLSAFASHYGYDARPVAPYRGNEKGRVERTIRDVRTSFFAARTWTDLADLNAQAERWCHEVRGVRKHPDDRTLTVAAAFAEEREVLRALPADVFQVADRVEVKAGKTPYVRFDGNDYSVPHDRVRRSLTVMATSDTVRVMDGQDVIATHARSWDKGAQVEDAAHIEGLVECKRRARNARGLNRVFVAAPVAQEFVRRLAERGGNIGNAVARLGELLDAFGAEELATSVDEAIAMDAPHIAAVRQVLDRRRRDAGLPAPVAVDLPDDPRIRNMVVRRPSLEAYDALKGPKEDFDE